jgi:hypothetical protein
MNSFFSKYSFLVIWILVIIIVGALFVLVVQPSLHFGLATPADESPIAAAPASTPVAASSPSITLTIEKSKTGNSLFVQWQNLPDDTTALNIFRGMKNSTSGWSLWKTLTLTSDQLANGSASIDLEKATLAGYSFYVEAVDGNATGTTGTEGSGSNPTVLWTSSVSDPTVSTSKPSAGPAGQNNNPTTPGTPSPSPSSTILGTPPASSSSAPAPTTPPPTPSGTPFYNPQVQIEGYGPAQTNNFWVQHVDQKIQIGWQNLPPTTDGLVILRAQNQDGPWAVVLTQENPGVNGAYSIQVVDDTLGTPYYYEMNAVEGSTTIATYGPVYLFGNQ